MAEEIFLEVNGYNGQYLISNMGNMLTRSRNNKDKYIPLKGWKCNRGYIWKWE